MAERMTEEYRLSMGPVANPRPFRGRSDQRFGAKIQFGNSWRASLPNGWGPPCFHRTAEAAIDCLDQRIGEVMRS